MALNVLSLFSGGGGLDIGFAQAGFSIVASSDINPLFCESLEANKEFFGSDHRVFCEDITKFEPDKYNLPRIDFIIGGPPCQSFSAAGRRAGGVYGINDLRGSLFWHYCRILESIKPKGFLFENVRGILSANNKDAWKTIVDSFSQLGYRLHFRVVDCAEFGVPQHRERVIMVGTSCEKSFLFPRPTHGPKSKTTSSYVSALSAVSDLQDPSERYIPYGGMYEELLLEIPPGQNYLYFTEKMGHKSPKFAWRSRFSDFLYVADPHKPTKTIVAQPGKWAGPFHWNKRKFTIKELQRLFTFPDAYHICGSELNVIKQLGNSVPPKLAFILAQAVLKQLFTKPISIDLVDADFAFDHDKRKGLKARATKKKVISNKQFMPSANNDLLAFMVNKGLNAESSFNISYFYDDLRHRIPIENVASRGELFHFTGLLKNGQWSIAATQANCPSHKYIVEFTLSFIKPIQGMFSNITVILKCNDPKYIAIGWDAVDLCVSESTSYSDIQKLYGHFTEPYPMFEVKLANKGIKDSIILFAESICNYSYLSEYHKAIELLEIFPSYSSHTSCAKDLRKIGFDVRTHETNRTVPEGYFRVCYPFTMPLTCKNFITWREKGQHKTADRTSIPFNGEKSNTE